ncbi:MAG: Ig-like domain-containing protein, partial [Planctomycetota bacterium]|nr:Ig-like domain-containing protein [Planctomycetota bacterium]
SLAGTGTLGPVTDLSANSKDPAVYGVYTAPLTAPTKVGSGTVSAVVNGVAIVQTATVTYAPGPATHFSIAGVPDPIQAGTLCGATITALDQFDNVATDYNLVASLTLTGTKGPNGASAGPEELILDFANTATPGIVTPSQAIAFGAVGEQTATATGPDPTDPTKTITGTL